MNSGPAGVNGHFEVIVCRSKWYNIDQAFPANTTPKYKPRALPEALKNIALHQAFYTSYFKVLFVLPGMRLLQRYTV